MAVPQDVDRLPTKANANANVRHTQSSKPNPHNIAANGRNANPFANLPCFRDTPVGERTALFRQRLRACCTVYDFSDPESQVIEKEAKRAALVDMVEYIQNNRACLTDEVLKDIVVMVSANLFRALPPPQSQPAFWLDEEEDLVMEASWAHLQVVYEFFLRVVSAEELEVKVARRYITHNFVLRLLDLLLSEDSRERDYLKTVLHKIYGKVMPLRSFIRKSVQQFFHRFLYELDGAYPHGVAELLEIFGSVIHGFNVPLKDDHIRFLQNALIPLFRARSLSSFQQPLLYCFSRFIMKENPLIQNILRGLLRFWPKTNTVKETLFLCILEELLFQTHTQHYLESLELIFKRIAACITSPHFQVAERALFFWNNLDFVKMVSENRQEVFPVLIAALHQNTRLHWSQAIHTLNYGVLKLLMEADPPLFDDHFSAFKREDVEVSRRDVARVDKWNEIMDMYPTELLDEEADDFLDPDVWPAFRREVPRNYVEPSRRSSSSSFNQKNNNNNATSGANMNRNSSNNNVGGGVDSSTGSSNGNSSSTATNPSAVTVAGNPKSQGGANRGGK